ncbi:MAG: hypothetical protein BGO77_00355 [Caedibacter sp. 37-49]|nr:MAG: hypothetical protein BGO77_00355 [Caedibacter sp. 37-49]
MDLVKLRIFYTVARFGNLTKAAEFLNTSQSSLSRSMKEFESQVKMKLFQRNARGVTLSLEGRKIFQHASELMQENEEFLKNFRNNDKEVRGELKIVTTPHMGASWLMQYLNEYLELYPEINIKILCKTENLNLQEADVAICTYISHHPNLIQHPLKSLPMGLWASPQYIKEHGMPRSIDDLDNHRILAYTQNLTDPYGNFSWILTLGAKTHQIRKPYLEINSLEGLINATIEGIGIAELSKESPLVQKSNLVNLFPELQGPMIDIHYIYKESLQNVKSITSMKDFLIQKINANM